MNDPIVIDVSMEDVLDQFTIAEIVEHYGADALLAEIGLPAAAAYFDIDPEPNGRA